jgi:protein SCO1
MKTLSVFCVTATLFLAFASVLFAADPKPPCCREIAPGPPLSTRSIYQLESTWTSDVGREVHLSVLRGHPQVVAMFFTSCEAACPIIVDDMKRIEKSLPDALRGKVEFLLISFDDQRDTPTVLHAYREKMKLPVEHWTLLRGAADDVRELAAVLGVNFQKDTRGQFMHSNLITALNADGEIIHQQTGLHSDSSALIQALAQSLSPQSASSARKN